MSNSTIENVYTRQAAKELTHRHFWKLLCMMLIVLAITYAAAFVCVPLAGGLAEATGSGVLAFVLSLVAVLAVTLVTSGLNLGLTSAMLYIARDGAQPTVSQVFSRMGQCLKAFGLSLWVGLKTFLWMLPGYVLMLFTVMGVLAAVDSHTAQVTEETAVFLTVLPFLFLILIFALAIPAAFRYMLSTYILADKPETGVFDCVRQSKALMKGHKWQAFKLAVPPMLLLFLAEFFMALAYSVLGTFLADSALTSILAIVMMIGWIGLSLYFSLRVTMGYCIFYTKRTAKETAAETQPEAE